MTFRNEYLCVQHENNKISAFFWPPYQWNPYLIEQRSYVHSLIQVLGKATVLLNVNLLHACIKKGVLIIKVMVLISPPVLWHMMTTSKSRFLSWLWIYSLPGYCMSIIIPRIQMVPLVKDSLSVHHPIICTSLKNITIIYLSINITVHFVFNAWMEYRGRICRSTI